MESLVSLHPAIAALTIFTLRIIDVSLGTLRTISVVQGRIKLSVLLGFFETFVWLTAVAQALMGIEKNPLLMLAYCAGFAAGNAVGIQIERKIAMGLVVIRMFSSQEGGAIASALSLAGWHPTTFQGIGAEGPRTMTFVIAPRRRVRELLQTARGVDPHVYYSVDLVREYHGGPAPALNAASRRSPFRMRK
jgi:uncharacterized protein YebE (UPF0316 family)